MSSIPRLSPLCSRAKSSQRLAAFAFSHYPLFIVGTAFAIALAFGTADARAVEAAGPLRVSNSDVVEPSGPIPERLLVWETMEKGIDASTDRFVVSFKNISPDAVVLLRVEPSCGCTTVKLPTLPLTVPSGQGLQLDVSVDLTGKSGTLLNTLTFGTSKGSKVVGLQSVAPSPLVVSVVDSGSPRATAPADQALVRDSAVPASTAATPPSAGSKVVFGRATPPPPPDTAPRPIPADAVDKSVLTWISEKPVPIDSRAEPESERAAAPIVAPRETTRTPELPPSAHSTDKQPMNRSCPNGDLEYGNLNGWVGYYGSRSGSPTISLNNLQAGIVSGRLGIVGPGFDPILGGSILPTVSEGTSALQLGNASGGGGADAVSYTFTVTPQNKHFSFRYAVVLQDPTDHKAGEKPFFSYYVLRGNSLYFNSNNLPIAGAQIIADRTSPFFTVASNDVVYRKWTSVCLDLSNYLGQTMTIAFFTADCSFTLHFGYAYIDGLCLNNDPTATFTMPDEVCPGGAINVDGSASTNEDSYFWSVEESDANWGRNPATEKWAWFVAQQAGPLDLNAPQNFYRAQGGQFKCNTYYRIKLAVTNQCGGWVETVKLLHVRCPTVTAGPDLCVPCTSNGSTVQLGIGNPPGNTYVWTPSTGLNNASSPSPQHLSGSVAYPFTYTVKVTDTKGCSNSDQVTLYCQRPMLQLEQQPNCCGVTIASNAQNYSTITWSNGATNVASIDVRTPGVYTVTASNPCGSTTGSVTVAPASFLTGPAHPISYNSKFNPPSGSSILKDKLYIMDVVSGNGAANVPNSYNVTQYTLDIFDRWGHIVKTMTGSSCNGFNNWAICWDGTDQTGQIVKQDVYVWKLTFANCDGVQPVIERKFVDPQCIKWATLFGIKLWCKEWDHPGPTTVDVPVTTGSVTVLP